MARARTGNRNVKKQDGVVSHSPVLLPHADACYAGADRRWQSGPFRIVSNPLPNLQLFDAGVAIGWKADWPLSAAETA